MTPSQRIALQSDIMQYRQLRGKLCAAAYEVVARLCEGAVNDRGHIVDTKKMHAAFRVTGMSTAELRTIMQEKAVTDGGDACKIILGDMKNGDNSL